MTARTRRVRTEMTVDEARAYGAAARAANTPKAARVHDVEAALAAHNNTQIAKERKATHAETEVVETAVVETVKVRKVVGTLLDNTVVTVEEITAAKTTPFVASNETRKVLYTMGV